MTEKKAKMTTLSVIPDPDRGSSLLSCPARSGIQGFGLSPLSVIPGSDRGSRALSLLYRGGERHWILD